jgi:cell wall-associated NlpC family hydrolase
VSVPRTSAEQAQAGYEIGRELAALEPGDILTFAERRDGRVTHVGLYVGDGKFIHSASSGVQLSTLSDQDATGLWWHARWVGARRVMER